MTANLFSVTDFLDFVLGLVSLAERVVALLRIDNVNGAEMLLCGAEVERLWLASAISKTGQISGFGKVHT